MLCWRCPGSCVGDWLAASWRRFTACHSSLEGFFWLFTPCAWSFSTVPSCVMLAIIIADDNDDNDDADDADDASDEDEEDDDDG